MTAVADRRPWRNPAPRLGLAALAATFALAACTGGGGDGGSGDAEGLPAPADGATATTASPAVQSPTADDFNKLLSSEDGLVEPQQVEIVAVDETAPGVLLVSFEMASHHCFGVHAAVTETDAAVTLDLHTGRRAGVSPAGCPFGVFPYTTEVTLGAPLGAREVMTDADTGSAAGGIGTGTGTASAGGVTSGTTGPDATTGDDGTTAAPDALLDPAEVDPATIPADGIDRYVGHHVEDGVEWALANQRTWRILSEDGTDLADGSSDPGRLSFTVVADVIVGYEWS